MKKLRHNVMLFAAILLSVLTASAYAVSPRVIKTVPENGDQNVDPSLRQIKIEFDQDMSQQGYSICGGGPTFPKMIGKPKWISKKTLIAAVKLEPNHEYEMSVNCPSYQSCKNINGEPAEIYPVNFKTSSASKEPNVPSKSPAVLLQEGLYAEETEGNLDKAIEIYQQVIDDSGETQRVAAKATYQLGMCYLKKDQKDKAVQYFQQVVSNYPAQKILVGKAQSQLGKILPAENVIAKSYVIHYKANDQSANAFKIFNENHPQGVRTHHANRYKKNGETINSICTYTEAEKDKIVDMINTSGKLTLVNVESPKAAEAGSGPQVISTTPAAFADDVDPNLDKITVTFNTALMDQSWSWTDGGDTYPQTTGKPFYDETKTTCTMPVKLEAGKVYWVGINSPSYKNFQTTSGIPAKRYVILFATMTADGKPTPISDDKLAQAKAINNATGNQSLGYADKLKNKVTVNAAKSPESDRLTVQYAVIEVCKAADVPYQWEKSQKMAGEKARRYIEPIHFENVAADEALNSILEPLGLTYAIDANGIYLADKKAAWAQERVEDFFKHNYRDITSRKTIEWGNPVTDANGNVAISYKYEMIIWDKDKFIANEIFTFDKNGKSLNVQKVEGFPKPLGKVEVSPEDVSTKESIQKLVEKFFSRNYRDITSRKTIEWGEPNRDPNGNVSIRYKFEAVIGDKNKMIMNKVFTFDKNGQYVSATDVKDSSIKDDLEKGKDENGSFLTPEKTIQSFMAAAVKLDSDKAMIFVAPDSHDYNDIKQIFEMPENPFNVMFRKIDTAVPVKIIKAKITDSICEAIWQVTFKEEFTIEGKTFNAGETFDIDGNLHKYGDKWLITGI